MKKILSIVLSMLMAASVMTISVAPAMAKTYSSQETTTAARKITTQVNGKGSNDITYKVDENDKDKITFTYTGDGDLTGWDFGDLVEGTDYTIISEDGNTIVVQLDSSVGGVTVSADVDGLSADEDPSVKPDDTNKSPKTGASLAGVAVAGAGLAMLLGLKKKDDAE